MKRLGYLFLFFIFSNSLVFGQTSLTVIKSTRPAVKLKKILVLSLLKDYENRKTVENEISWWLNDKGFQANAYNKLVNSEVLPSRAAIDELVNKYGFDGILVSNLTDVELKERYENNMRDNNYNLSNPTFYNYLDAYNNTYKMGYNYNTKSYVINTRLFEKTSEQTLLEVSSSTYESMSLDKAIESYAKSLCNVLKKSKILEKKEANTSK